MSCTRPALRLERQLPHAPQTVWRAITTPEQLSRWYPFRATELEPRAGGRVSFDDGDGTVLTATITDFAPEQLFAFDEHDPEDAERPHDDHVRIELQPDDTGCRLVFTHILTDPSTIERTAAGWTACLDALGAQLDAQHRP